MGKRKQVEKVETTDLVETISKGIKADNLKTEVKLVPPPLTKNCCKDRSGDGHICGSVYREITKQGNKIIRQVCYPNRHPLPTKKAKVLKFKKAS